MGKPHPWEEKGDPVGENDRAPQSRALRLLLENLRVTAAKIAEEQRIKCSDSEASGAPQTPKEIEEEDEIEALLEQMQQMKCGDAEPLCWNHEEEDVTYTSKTVFALLGVLLGNTLGIDLKPLLKQAHGIKLVEQDEDVEF